MPLVQPFDASKNSSDILRVQDDRIIIDGVSLSLGQNHDIQLTDIAITTDGNIVVVGQVEFSSDKDIVFKLFSPTLEELTDFVLVSSTTRNDQLSGAITTTSDGGFAIGWRDDSLRVSPENNRAVPVRFFDSDGNATSEEILVDTGQVGLRDFTVLSIDDNKLLVGYEFPLDGDQDVNLKTVDSSGNTQEVPIPFNFGRRVTDIELFAGHDGDIWLHWTNSNNKYGAIFDQDLSVVKSAFQVNFTPNSGSLPYNLTALTDGTYVATWGDSFRKFDSTGAPLTVDLDFDVAYAAPLALPNGDFIATYRVSDGNDGNRDLRVAAQRFDTMGNKVGLELLISEDTDTGLQNWVSDIFDASFVSAWFESGGETAATYLRVSDYNSFGEGDLSLLGAPLEDESLSFSSTILDADGLGQFILQWQRDGIDIPNAEGTIYSLTQDDVGAEISLQMNYLDDKGFREYFVSNSLGPVENVNDTPTGNLAIKGTTKQGQTLTIDISGVSDADGISAATGEIQWQRNGLEISGATGVSYLLTQEDVGTAISVIYNYTDNFDTAESVTSAVTEAVTNTNDEPSGAVSITGLASQNETLSADTSGLNDLDGLGLFSYVWLRDGTPISGATASSYELTQDDVGAQISVELSYTDGFGADESVTSAATNPVVNVNDDPSGIVIVIGQATQGETLTVDTSNLDDPDGLDTFSFVWLRDGTSILGATEESYELTQADVGAEVSVEVSYTDGFGTEESVVSGLTAAVINTNDDPSGSVGINGTVSQGETLTADTSNLDDPDGLGNFSYQWLRDGNPISGSNANTYVLTQEDVGSQISVEVSYTDGFGADETVISALTVAVTNVNDDPTGAVVIVGAVSQGETLTADISELDDPDGLGTFSYVWLRDGTPILSATSSGYELTQADVGAEISVEVSYTDAGGTVENIASAATTAVINSNDDPTGSVGINGTVSQGETLTVDTSNLDDPDGLDTFSFVWLRDGTSILGATEESYELTQDDVGTAVSVQVSYTDGYGTAESVVSDPTPAVASNDDTIEGDDGDNTLSGGDGEDTLSGGPGNDTLEGGPDADRFVIKPGDQQITILDFELGLDLLDLSSFQRADALAAFYNAQSGSAILTFGDGTIVTVEGDGVSPDSLAIDDVEFAAGNLSPQGPVVITGNTTTGQTLTADASGVSDGDGIKSATVEFQWLRDGVAITDATASTYVLTLEDVGSALSVSYSYTDNFDTAESVTSATTSNVVASGQEISGTLDPDDLVGGLGSDTIQALAGDDTITGGAGNDQIDGGEGTDTAVYSGNQTSYTLTLSPTGTSVTDRRADGNGTDTLIDMEFLDFDTNLFGGPVNLGIFSGPTNLSATDLESIVELYIAYFNRAPDAEGLYFWGAVFNNGYTLAQLANGFIDQDETRAAYPESLSNEDFATVVYGNVLGRIPDQTGFDFWVGALDSGGVSRDQFILSVLGGAKVDPPVDATQEFIDQQILDRAYLETKTDIGAYFAVHKGMSDVDNATAAMGFFNGTAPSVISVIDAIDGFYADALDPNNGEFLMQLVGVLDDPFV